jgi:hypothetical protein
MVKQWGLRVTWAGALAARAAGGLGDPAARRGAAPGPPGTDTADAVLASDAAAALRWAARPARPGCAAPARLPRSGAGTRRRGALRPAGLSP